MKKTIAFVLVFGVMIAAAVALTRIIPRPTPKGTVDQASLKKLFRPRLGGTISPDIRFRDESGKAVTMGDFGKDRPYILVPAYLRCPRLCTYVLNDLVKCLQLIPNYELGKDYDVVVVSFDPREKPELARAKREAYAEEFNHRGTEAGWHFLTGEQDQIDRLLGEIGYKVIWDENKKEYAHASGIVVCSPEGAIARYFPGLDYRPLYVRLAITEAGRGKIAPALMDQVLLPCFSFDETRGQYSAAVLLIVKAAGAITVAGLAILWLGLTLLRRGKRTARAHAERVAHGSHAEHAEHAEAGAHPAGV